MSCWERVKHHFIPSKKNAYRPHLLGRQWLVFFLAVTMAVEGFLVADLVAQQSNQAFLASVASAAPVATQNQSMARSFTNSLERQFTRLLDQPEPPVNGALVALGAFLILLVALGFFIHIEIQPAAMLMGGVLVAALAFSFIFLNGRLLGPGINNLHQVEASAIVSL